MAARELQIYTYGSAKRKHPPANVEHDFNVCGVSNKNKVKGINLKKHTGFDGDLQERIINTDRFQAYITKITELVEKRNLKCISIHCLKGRHRSVCVANYLKDKIYPDANVYHMELGKSY